MALATLFREQHAQSARWYMADLLGAGLGVALVVPAMQALGAMNGALLAVVCLALAALLWHAPLAAAKGWHARPLPALAAAVLVLLFIANLRTEILPLNWQALDDAKPLHQAWNDGATIEATRWDAFGRADLLTSVSGARQLYLDGAAPSVLPAAQDIAELTRQIGYLPFASGQPDAVFIIGPGGGLDIAYARASGAPSASSRSKCTLPASPCCASRKRGRVACWIHRPLSCAWMRGAALCGGKRASLT